MFLHTSAKTTNIALFFEYLIRLTEVHRYLQEEKKTPVARAV